MPSSPSSPPIILLVDNGSKQPAARVQLIKLARQLSEMTSQVIHPVSLQHAEVVLYDFLNTQLQSSRKKENQRFLLLPLFFGKSRALTKFIPDTQSTLEKEFGAFDLNVADVIGSDGRLAEIITGNIQSLPAFTSNVENIVLVDHGSPDPQITLVRSEVAKRVQTRLSMPIAEAAMERRAGAHYDFNGELLEDWLMNKAEQGATNAIVALLFALPGRHAGAGGDIEKICQIVMQRHPNFKVSITPLVGEHPLLLEILADRLNV